MSNFIHASFTDTKKVSLHLFYKKKTQKLGFVGLNNGTQDVTFHKHYNSLFTPILQAGFYLSMEMVWEKYTVG